MLVSVQELFVIKTAEVASGQDQPSPGEMESFAELWEDILSELPCRRVRVSLYHDLCSLVQDLESCPGIESDRVTMSSIWE